MNAPLHRKKIEQPPPSSSDEEDSFLAGTSKVALWAIGAAMVLWVFTIVAVKVTGFR